ncbi:MAG: type I methionyl aminopeptidase [Actinomycetota bacterium]
MIARRSKKELERIKAAGAIVAETLRIVEDNLTPGITTGELDRIAERHIRQCGAEPAFLGYHGFPNSLCISLNDEVVHGIPKDDKKISNGDLVSVDVGAIYKNFYGDGARTFAVGQVLAQAIDLIETTRDSLKAGIEYCRPGQRVGDISAAVQSYVEGRRYSVVRRYVGHGIGRRMHEDPPIPNFGEPGTGPVIKPGMVFAIEPMVNMGGSDVKTLDDGWTVVTADGSLSAHYEHTVAVTKEGPVILTGEEASFV